MNTQSSSRSFLSTKLDDGSARLLKDSKELDTCKLNNLKRCGSTCVMSINKEISDESLKWNGNKNVRCFYIWLAVALVRRRSIFCAKYVYDKAQGDAGRMTKDKDGAAAVEYMSLPVVALLAQKSNVVASVGNTKRSVQCYEFHDFGHIAFNCPKKKFFCAYCKITGHHISDCRHHPNSLRPGHQAYQMIVTKPSGSFPVGDYLKG
ncbi:hypothetical protein H5410_045319 [Solanum commersonii]|uniref:Uncharacterized protein n=1 Tax=Solanum commersonii TaxID=4109 RepID=A0A9J5XBA3_SOLCO|nr:hypothetical protein H5410_045319 [Solanum commersonii]